MRSRSVVYVRLIVLLAATVQLLPIAYSQHTPLEYSKWSGKLNVPDPVALSVDDQGRVFITQTRRRKIQDLDIRQHSLWIPADVGLSSVQDKSDFLRRVLAIDGDQAVQSEHVQDLNGDGEYDWRDLTVVSEAIYRLVDTSGDGKADQITTFAEGFNTEVTGIAAGVLAHEGSVFATVAPDLWRLSDSDDDGKADSRESVAHGFGLHIAYAGHDMHGPIVGPDGRIYWSIGDKGISVTDKAGKHWHYPNQGGVMRCEPDGSNFEVFAHGLRNVQEFDFDQYGNIFGIDNDADKPDERERFVWIVADMDAGWRCNYQYRSGEYSPWTDEGLWKVQVQGKASGTAEISLDDSAAYLVPPISHYIDGPAGFKFNPGSALSEDYENYFFSTGAPEGIQHAFRVEPTGDTFKMVDDHRIGSGVAIVGIAFGPDGALYGADWDGGYPLDQKGSVARIDTAEQDRHPLRAEVQKLLRNGFSNVETQSLVTFLGHQDRRIRLAAQFELVARDDMYSLSSIALDTTASTLARLHGIWGVAMLGRRGTDTFPRDTLGGLLRDSDEAVRSVAAASYAEMPRAYGFALINLLKDKSLKVRIQAGLALGRFPTSQAKKPLLEASKELQPDQHYLRHSIVTAMASCIDEAGLAELESNESESTRVCAVLALRRLESPETKRYLIDASAKVATAAARAIHDDQSIAPAMEALASTLGKVESLPKNEAFVRRAINANFRLGNASAAQRLVRFAANEKCSPAMREVALETLALWYTPPKLDLVDGRARELPRADRLLPEKPVANQLGVIIGSASAGLQATALRTATKLGLELPLPVLLGLLDNQEAAPDSKAAALDAILVQTQQLVIDAAESEPPVQLAAIKNLSRLADKQQQVFVDKVLAQKDADIRVLRELIRFLANQGANFSGEKLRLIAKQAAKHELPAGLQLDVVLACQKRDLARKEVATILARGNSIAEDEAFAVFGLAIQGGDPEAGKDIFNNHVVAQCSRCHRAGGSGSNIGPNLANVVKKRDDKHLLRSLLNPSADIEDKYQSNSYLLYTGNVVQGVPVRETKETVTIADSNGKEIELLKEDIEESVVQKNSLMPSMSEVLKPEQMRDLIAFLRSL